MAETVKIGCRVPSGLRLRVYEMQDTPEGQMAVEVGMIELAGSGDLSAPEGDATYSEVEPGLWDKWLAMNKDSDLIANRTVYKGNASAKTPAEKEAAATPAPEKPADKPVAAPSSASAASTASTPSSAVSGFDKPKAP